MWFQLYIMRVFALFVRSELITMGPRAAKGEESASPRSRLLEIRESAILLSGRTWDDPPFPKRRLVLRQLKKRWRFQLPSYQRVTAVPLITDPAWEVWVGKLGELYLSERGWLSPPIVRLLDETDVDIFADIADIIKDRIKLYDWLTR